MKERPILFSGPMVRAILDGRKTMTRRVMKVQPPSDKHVLGRVMDSTSSDRRRMIDRLHWLVYENYRVTDSDENYFFCPYGVIGDRLWVRESWAINECGRRVSLSAEAWPNGWPIDRLQYAATDEAPYIDSNTDKPYWWNLRPSIHMPRWASRITLEITGVRFERVQKITDADALAEGVDRTNTSLSGYATERFKRLWEKINGKKHPWVSNPWVWVIEFRTLLDG